MACRSLRIIDWLSLLPEDLSRSEEVIADTGKIRQERFLPEPESGTQITQKEQPELSGKDGAKQDLPPGRGEWRAKKQEGQAGR